MDTKSIRATLLSNRECVCCGLTVACKCNGHLWPSAVVRAMVRARESVAAYKEAWSAHPLRRLELRDQMEAAQGKVVDLQWVYFDELKAVRS